MSGMVFFEIQCRELLQAQCH